MKITVKSNIDEATRGLSDLARRQIPFATSRALNATAKSVQDRLSREITSRFDRPTPWIQKSPFVRNSSKENLEAIVGIKNQGRAASQAVYLAQHFEGGGRGNKPMEKAMRAAGILPAGWLAVPSQDGVQKDAYGNVSKATVARIIAALQNGGRQQKGGNSFRLFIVRPDHADPRTRHLEPGIWSVSGFGDQTILKPVFLFVRAATYRQVIDLPAIAQDVVQREFDQHFATALDQALRTAR